MDPITADPDTRLTLTGRDSDGKGFYVKLITGIHKAQGYSTSTIKIIAIMRFCGFVVYEHKDAISVCCDPKAVSVPLRKLKCLAHGYAYTRYLPHDKNSVGRSSSFYDPYAVARYPLDSFLYFTAEYNLRSSLVIEEMARNGAIKLPELKDEIHRYVTFNFRESLKTYT